MEGHSRLPPRPSSVGEARRLVHGALTRAGRADLIETAELLVSEVVTNALVHAGTPIDVSVTVQADGLRVEVGDGSPHLPSPRGYAPTAGTGRGLLLLERMVDDWGVTPNARGKTVWFHLAQDGRVHDHHSPLREATGFAARRSDTVAVQLLDVPLLLHAAWRQHAEATLREYLLATLDLDPGEGPIRLHSEASDAIALLAEHIPVLQIGEQPGEVLAGAIEPDVSSARVELPVPVESIPHFRTLDQTLDVALEWAEDGRFLTPPVQPELRAVRRWLCQQVDEQSRGADPTPWSAEEHGPPEPTHPLAWDSAPVVGSADALIAADDTNRIIAVSRPALALLGYDDPQQLVGRRLVTVIPTRYRQAHVAGFTLHFLTGRSPLLGNTVVVPALRRDGTETMLELTIRAERVPHGRAVFTAELLPAR